MGTVTIDHVQLIVAIVIAMFGSSGFWLWIMKRMESKDVRNKLLLGLAHDRIVYLGMQYIDQGYITQDEHENLYMYLYQPYLELGGNGGAKRVIDEVNKLPICSNKPLKKEKKDVSSSIEPCV